MKTMFKSTLALLAAALAPTALIVGPDAVLLMVNGAKDPSSWSRLYYLVSAILITTFMYVTLLGIPALLILQRRNAVRWWSAIGCGFVLACLPIAYGAWPYSDAGSTASHWNGERMIHTMIDGIPTTEGWISYAKLVATFGLFGAFSGLAFWIVWHSLRSRNVPS